MSDLKPQKQDLRVSRTHKALVSALFILLEKVRISKITVNDLCETAMVSRATFYAHFEDKYHLLRFGLAQLKGQLSSESCLDRRQLITQTLDRITDKPQLFRNLFLDDSSQELREMLSALFVEDFTQELERLKAEGKVFPVPPEVIAVFLSGGMAHMMLWWIKGGFSLTKEEMAEHLMTISSIKLSECGDCG